jgi:DNA-binding IclR family transcriptional regulator
MRRYILMLLAELFQDSSAAKILDVLASAPGRSSTVPMLAAAGKVDVRTARRAVQHLTRLGALVVDARFGVGMITFADGPTAEAVLAFQKALRALEKT